MCVPLARCIVEAAMATAAEAPPEQAPLQSSPTAALVVADSNDKQACRELEKRVRVLEAQLCEIHQRLVPASVSEGDIEDAATQDPKRQRAD